MSHVDDDVFGQDEWGSSNERIVLSGSFSADVAIEAMSRIANRFLLTDQRGVEYPDFEIMEDMDLDYYTPNFASGPIERSDGVYMYVDCKGGIDEPMRQRFLVILREELADLPAARVSVASFDE